MPENVLTVAELTLSIRTLLESSFARVWVEGEISNYVRHSSGHQYFTLKDETAQIRCVLWKGMSRYVFFEIEDGIKVVACGQVSVYDRSGQYQLVISTMHAAGLGKLEIAFQQLKAKLEREGLFDEGHKKPLPEHPQRIGVVTSPTGAAIQDIIKVIRNRSPWVEITLRPTAVQGQTAAADIAQAIKEFNEYGQVDLLIVGRGGGSLEDLWPFNEEIVARAIYDSKLPVISAVGHQVDFTISDFVADLRAPTPSAAAELAVPEGTKLWQYLADNFQRLCRAELRRVQLEKDALVKLVRRYGIRRPLEIVNWRSQRLDELDQSFQKTASHMIEVFGNNLSLLQTKLDSFSPLAILSRGYAHVSRSDTKEPIKSFAQVAVGDSIDVRLHQGGLRAGVTKVRGV